jgi:hypothetical protein
MDREPTQIDEQSTIPLRIVWTLVALTACAVLWGARLEAKTDTKVDRVQYATDISTVQADLKAIKRHLKIPD